MALATSTEFSYEKMYGYFARQKNTGHNNEVAQLMRSGPVNEVGVRLRVSL